MEVVKSQMNHRQRQALATQALIVDTSCELFLQQGYGATTIEAIADRAGVSVSTVYAIFKNKRGILRAIREAWHSRSEQRDIYHEALQQTDAARRIELAAHATRRQWETGADMIDIYKSAAAIDGEAAAELNQALQGRRKGLELFISASAHMFRRDITQKKATAIYHALTQAELYQELVERGGWSPDDYESWLAGILKQQLLT